MFSGFYNKKYEPQIERNFNFSKRRLYLLTILMSLNEVLVAKKKCLILKENGCLECGSHFYNPNIYYGMGSQESIFPVEDCKEKYPEELIYEKTVFVRNSECTVDQIACDYSNFGIALIEQANNSLPFVKGSINIVMVGSPHFIGGSSSQFIELFKRSGISLFIRALEKEECIKYSISDCPEKVLIVMKTQMVSLFISRNMTVKGIVFDGSDLYFSECGVETICCKTEDLFQVPDPINSPCGLNGLDVFGILPENLQKIPAFFALLTMEDYENEIVEPFLMLEKVEFRNIYALFPEFSWQVLIKASDLQSEIVMKNVSFINNFLPLGIFKQITLDEDPYFSNYYMGERETVYSKFRNQTIGYSKYSLSLSDVSISSYWGINFHFTRSKSQLYPDWILFEIRGFNYKIYVKNMTVENCFPLKNYFLIKITNNVLGTPSSFISNLYLKNNTGVSLIKSTFTSWVISSVQIIDAIAYGKAFFVHEELNSVWFNNITLENVKFEEGYELNVFSLLRVKNFHAENLFISDSIITMLLFMYYSNQEYFSSFTFKNISIVRSLLLTIIFMPANPVAYYDTLTLQNINITETSLDMIIFNQVSIESLLFSHINISKNDSPFLRLFGLGEICNSLIINYLTLDSISIEVGIYFDNWLIESVYRVVFVMNNSIFRNIKQINDFDSSPMCSFTSWKNIVITNTIIFDVLFLNSIMNTKVSSNYFLIRASINLIFYGCNFTITKNNSIYLLILTYLTQSVTISKNIFLCRATDSLMAGGFFFQGTQHFLLQNNLFDGNIFNTEPLESPLYQNTLGIYAIICINGYSLDSAQVDISNNTFKSLQTKLLHGVIGVFDYINVKFYGNSFYNCEAKFGGGLALIKIKGLEFVSNYFSNCFAIEGGSIYLSKLGNVLLENSTITSSFAKLEGGAVFAIDVINLTIKKLNLSNTTATIRGGGFSLNFISKCDIDDIFLFDLSADSAAVFYIEDVNITINHTAANYSKAQIGGFCVIVSPYSTVYIENTLVENSFSTFYGGIFYLTLITNVKFQNIITKYCKVKGEFGVLTLSDFSYKWDSIRMFELFNISCLRNIANAGSCLSINTNCAVKVRGLFIEGNIGSAVQIKSDLSTNLEIVNMLLKNNNYNISDDDKAFVATAIIIRQACFSLVNSSLVDNFVYGMLVKIDSSRFNLETCKFISINLNSDYLKKGKKFFGILISSSSCTIENTLFDNHLLKNINFIFLLVKFSTLLLSGVSVNSCLTNNSQPILIEKSSAFIDGSRFSNNYGIFSSVFNFVSSIAFLSNSIFINNMEKKINSTKNSESSVDIISFDTDGNINTSSILNILSCKFTNRGGVSIIAKTIQLVFIRNTLFEGPDRYFQTQSKALNIESIQALEIKDCIFKMFIASTGGAISLNNFMSRFKVRMSAVILNCSFFNNEAQIGGAINIAGNIKIVIIDTTFFGNNAFSGSNSERGGVGGGILLDCKFFISCSVVLFNCSFNSNKADIFGPAILSKTEKISILGCNFTNNSIPSNKLANDGLSRYPLKAVFLGDITNDLQNNESLVDAVKRLIKTKNNSEFWEKPQEIVSGWYFNTTIALTDFDSNLIETENSFSAYFSRSNNSKGNHTNSSVLILNGQTKSINGVFYFKNMQIIANPNITQIFNVTISIDPDLFFTDKYINNNPKPLQFEELVLNVRLIVRPCLRGEVVTEANICHRCESGYFSLVNPMDSGAQRRCEKCLSNSECRGGDLVTPLPGYWRASENSKLIIECPCTLSCEGFNHNISNVDHDILTKGKCATGHWGVLCFECEKGYIRLRRKALCKPCVEQTIVLFKMMGSILFLVFYVIFQAKSFLIVERQEPQMAICFKLLMNHFQTVNLISLVDFGWTKEFEVFFILEEYVAILTEDFITLDCFYKNINEDPYILKVIFNLVLPIILALLFFIIWLILFLTVARKTTFANENGKVPFKQYMYEHTRISFLIISYLLYPEILRKSFSLLSCKLIDDSSNEKVISFSPNITCWTSRHLFLVLTVSLPGVIFWGVSLPLLLFLILRYYKVDIIYFMNQRDPDNNLLMSVSNPKILEKKNSSPKLIEDSVTLFKRKNINLDSSPKMRKKLQWRDIETDQMLLREEQKKMSKRDPANTKIALNVGFLYRGYKQEYYYWEIILFFRKFWLILIGIFDEVFPNEIRANLLIVVISIFLYFHFRIKPFRYPYMNRLENVSLLVCFFTGNIGILLYSETLKPAAVFFVTVVAIINIGFLVYWIYLVVKKTFALRTLAIYLIKLKAIIEKLKLMIRTSKLKAKMKN